MEERERERWVEKGGGGLARRSAPARGRRALVGGVRTACRRVGEAGSLARGPEATVTGGTVEPFPKISNGLKTLIFSKL
jgi:hypothetical protein